MFVILSQPKYWLLAIALILVLLHLHLTQFGSDFLSHGFLFWLVTIVLIWQKWEFIYAFDVAQITARFSAFILTILGFEVSRQGFG